MKVLKEVDYKGPFIEETYIISEVQTTDATPTVIYSLVTIDDRGFFCECEAAAAPTSSNNRWFAKYTAGFQRKPSTNIQFLDSNTEEYTLYAGNTPSFRLVENTGTQNIDVEITGRTAITLNWLVTINFKYRV